MEEIIAIQDAARATVDEPSDELMNWIVEIKHSVILNIENYPHMTKRKMTVNNEEREEKEKN